MNAPLRLDGNHAAPTACPWSITIFSSREDVAVLEASIAAAVAATDGKCAVIDVVINGNPGLGTQLLRRLQAEVPAPPLQSPTLRLWSIPLGDKSNAWNEYLARLWPGSEIAFFIDGYAKVKPDSLRLLAAALQARPHALAAAGVPSVGRSAVKARAQMLREGGIHGNLYAVRGQAMAEMRQRGFHLPLGMYRTDSTMAAALNFSLDPAKHDWDPSRIAVHPDATWEIKALDWRRRDDLSVYFKRLARQYEGKLFARAVRHHLAICKRPPEALPVTASDLIRQWLQESPLEAAAVMVKNPWCLLAARKILRPRNWEAAPRSPELVAALPATH